MKHADELRALLRQHIGSQQIFRHSLARGVCYTEGVRDFAQHAGGGAYWLLDILATEKSILDLVREEGIAFATLDSTGMTAKLTVAADSGIPPVFTRIIDHTDCPAGEWMFYMSATEVGDKPVVMILLPSEY